MQTSTNPPDLPRIPRISRTISVALGRQPMQASTNPRGLPRIPRISRTIFVARGSPTDAGITNRVTYHAYHAYHAPFPSPVGVENPPPPVNQRSKTPQPLIHAGTQPYTHPRWHSTIHPRWHSTIHPRWHSTIHPRSNDRCIEARRAARQTSAQPGRAGNRKGVR